MEGATVTEELAEERLIVNSTGSLTSSPRKSARGCRTIESGDTITIHCPYCALQCGMQSASSSQEIGFVGDKTFPVNKGKLCIKGMNAGKTLRHPERLLTPLARAANGALEPIAWEDAYTRIARTLQSIQARYGKNAVGIFGGGSLTNEKAYLLGKFARVALETANIDYNGRFCMSSAATASIKAFGLDRGLPFPLEDIPQAEVLLLVGSNIAETMPPLMHYFAAQKRKGGKLIVIDPRSSLTARQASVHLQIKPGSDLALANGLMHLLLREQLVDNDYIARRTEGFAEVKALVASYTPQRVEQITGIAERQLEQVATILGTARSAMILTGRGSEQQRQGVNNTLAYINIALALGLVGRQYSGFGCLTGQGNGQGGREHGQKNDQLPGYRHIHDIAARQHIASVWGIEEKHLPHAGKSAYEMLDTIGQKDGIRALFIMGSNIVVSAPDALRVQEKLKMLDFCVSTDFFLSETAHFADIVLPAAQWMEEEGTMTNLEGRVILRSPVVSPPPGVQQDIDILCNLARYLGRERFFSYTDTEQVFHELRRASAGGIADYQGITYEKLKANKGIFWPCPTLEHPGQPRLFLERFPTASGRATFYPTHHQGPAEEIDDAYPLYLTSGRILQHYQSGNQTRRIDALCQKAPDPYIEIHPRTAQRYHCKDGERVKLLTRRGAAFFFIKYTPGIREDTIFVPFHWGGKQSVNRLTNAALDPVSKMPEFKVCAVRIERLSSE